MSRPSACLWLLPILLTGGIVSSGCGPSLSPTPRPVLARGPHGGVAHRLPDELGYVELTNEPEVDPRAPTPTALVLYFLSDDLQASRTPPTGLDLRVQGGRTPDRSVALTGEPRSGDPVGAGRFVTPPGPYNLAGLRGTLTGTINARPFTIDLVGSR